MKTTAALVPVPVSSVRDGSARPGGAARLSHMPLATTRTSTSSALLVRDPASSSKCGRYSSCGGQRRRFARDRKFADSSLEGTGLEP